MIIFNQNFFFNFDATALFYWGEVGRVLRIFSSEIYFSLKFFFSFFFNFDASAFFYWGEVGRLLRIFSSEVWWLWVFV